MMATEKRLKLNSYKCDSCIHTTACQRACVVFNYPFLDYAIRSASCGAYEPKVDAVEVVRCKDCKWYNRNEDIMPQSGSCEFHEMVKMDWDFCSRAKMDGDGNG